MTHVACIVFLLYIDDIDNPMVHYTNFPYSICVNDQWLTTIIIIAHVEGLISTKMI